MIKRVSFNCTLVLDKKRNLLGKFTKTHDETGKNTTMCRLEGMALNYILLPPSWVYTINQWSKKSSGYV